MESGLFGRELFWVVGGSAFQGFAIFRQSLCFATSRSIRFVSHIDSAIVHGCVVWIRSFRVACHARNAVHEGSGLLRRVFLRPGPIRFDARTWLPLKTLAVREAISHGGCGSSICLVDRMRRG